MRGWILAIVLLLCATQSQAISVNTVTGLAANGPPALDIPLTFSINCTSGCPTVAAPSFTDEERVWGATAICQTSTDRGTTWGNCAGATPVGFTTAIAIAEASDGSVIVAGRPLADAPASCTVYRSTDTGSTWSLVHSGNHFCSFAGGEADGNHAWCTETGRCVVIFRNVSTSVGTIYESSDNGATWSTVTVATVTGLNTTVIDTATGFEGGAYGISAASPVLRQVSAAWSTVAQVAGYECWGSFILSGAPKAACSDGISQKIFMNGVTGAIEKVITLPNTLTLAGTGILVTNVNDIALYAMAQNTSSGQSVFVSIDGGTSWSTLLSLSAFSTRGGTAFVHPANRCVYFSRTNSRVIGICR